MSSVNPLKTLRFRILFAVCWWLWSLIHAFLLNWYGFAWSIAILDSFVSNIFLAAISVLIFTLLQYYLPYRNRYRYIFGLCVVLTGMWFFITRTVLIPFIGQDTTYIRFFALSAPIRVAFSLLTLGCMSMASVLWYTVQEQRESEKRKSEAEQLAREAELSKLRQQLQPHFLFNSLNSINALIGMQPVRAREMVQYLSDFLRGTLKKEENQWVSIEEELQHLLLYLEIEKVRFGHRLNFEVVNQLNQDLWLLPAMLLQPIVENAIKFGLYGTVGDITIVVHAFGDSDYLKVEVTNPFDPTAHLPKGTGFGLSSVRRRLFLIFGRNDLLETKTDNEKFITRIKIPQER